MKQVYMDWKKQSPVTLEDLSTNNSDKPFLAVVNGCFDVLHAGHFKLLSHVFLLDYIDATKVRQFVLLNTDASIRENKSKTRPVVPFAERAASLIQLPWVDHVIGFSEKTPSELIAVLEPKILVKGAEYWGDEVPGASFVIARRGVVLFVPMELVPGDPTYFSSTRIIQAAQPQKRI